MRRFADEVQPSRTATGGPAEHRRVRSCGGVAQRDDELPRQIRGRVVVLGQTSAGRRLKIVLAGDVVVTAADRDDEA